MKIPDSVKSHAATNMNILKNKSEKLSLLYRNCFLSTLDSAVSPCEDNTYFVLTGDIPAMWLRDSSAQVNHYLPLCNDPEMAQIIRGVILRQFKMIMIDPYANAFNKEPNGKGMTEDLPKNNPWVWERKYETDSLCYPIRLLYRYSKISGDDSIVKNQFPDVMRTILNLWKTEQNHMGKSSYRFFRNTDIYDDTIHNNGMGAPVSYTGMTWSGFRPSDDGCTYGYYIPSNMFAAVTLGYAAEMLDGTPLAAEALNLKWQIENGIKKHGIIHHKDYGDIYAYETDGNGNYVLMDDANIPSLISAPYLGFVSSDDRVYQNTRRFLLSSNNPFYYEGKYAKGIGSPHTETGHIWHLALSMQGLTSNNRQEKLDIIRMLESTDADTLFMHEGFDCNNPHNFTRPWFTWSNSLFCEFIEKCIEEDLF